MNRSALKWRQCRFDFSKPTSLYCGPNRAAGVRSKRSRYRSDRCRPPSPGFSLVNTAKLWQQTATGSTTRPWEDKSARRPPRCFACSAWTWNHNSPFGEITVHTVHQHEVWLVDPPPWPLPLKVSCLWPASAASDSCSHQRRGHVCLYMYFQSNF